MTRTSVLLTILSRFHSDLCERYLSHNPYLNSSARRFHINILYKSIKPSPFEEKFEGKNPKKIISATGGFELLHDA